MNTKKILSIIIPVYNSEKYITECIESIIKQKNEKIEVLLIDDGSTDSSSKICDWYSENDKRINVIHKENDGVSSARNKGLSIAKGKYIMFVDSDDILDDDWSKIFNLISNDDVYYFTKTIEKKSSKNDMLKYIVGYNILNLCFSGPFSKIFKKSFLVENKITFNEKLINGEDMLFNINVILKSKFFSIINESYYNYRNFKGSATKRFDEKIITSDKYFHNELNKCLTVSNVNTKLKNDLCLYSIQMAIIIILSRIAYINNYKNAKEYFYFLRETPYKEIINKELLIKKKFNIIFKLLKKKHTYIIYKILRFRIQFKSLFCKKYSFTKI